MPASAAQTPASNSASVSSQICTWYTRPVVANSAAPHQEAAPASA